VRDGADRRRKASGLRRAALGVGLFGAGVLAGALWSMLSAPGGATARGRNDRRFSAFIEDLPIMPGLSESDDGYAFDLSDGGRLAEARLGGDADPAVVRGFYAAMLGQLGWRASDAEPYVYRRAGEQLVFRVAPRAALGPRRGAGLQALFVLAPDPGAAPGAR
jgi:hypothetical protein